jgi:colanic acid biosynthesis glycosyl transferase WcaI
MKILVLADNYLPEIAATSFRIHEHAKHWIECGHEVTVVTCVPNWPHGKTFAGYRNRFYQEETIDGVRVIRVWSYMAANAGFVKRTLDYLSFLLSAVMWCWRYPRCDVILATSPQFFTSVAGWLISWLRWRPWVFEVRDLWPASIEAVGAVRKPRLLRWLEQLELFLYRQATRVIAVTDPIRADLIHRGITADKIDVVTNGVDPHAFDPDHFHDNARQRLGIGADAILAGYIGTTGLAHGLTTILEAAALCHARIDVTFLIMGEGAERQRLEQLARESGLNNVRFADRVPREQLPAYLAAVDVPIIHLRPDPVFQTVIPSKMFEWMAMRKPLLMAVEGEAARIVAEHQCGVCIPSGDAAAMADAVCRLAHRRGDRAAMGLRGQQAVARHYSRRVKALAALQTLALAAGETLPSALSDMEISEGPMSLQLPDRAAA